jgi:membrane fusion protein (multidrug efflux system)
VPLDPMWVRFKVTESEYLSWIRQGGMPGVELPLKLILADQSEFGGTGHIENSLNQVDPKTATLELQARFPNPRHTILPGQFGRVRVQVAERKGAIVVQTVYTLDAENRVEVKPVITGDRVGNSWIIEQGLRPGDRVIVEGQQKVRPGRTVQPQLYHPPESASPSPKAGI